MKTFRWSVALKWDHITDHATGDSFPASEPTTYGADAQLPAAPVEELLNELALVSLPPFLPNTTFGFDGVSFAIDFGDSWRAARLCWWGHAPEEWRHLANCFDQAISLFEQHLPISTAQGSIRNARN